MSRLRSSLLSDLALLTLLAATAVVVAADVQPVRPFVVLAAACFVPGGAIITRLRTGELLTDVALAIALSLAVESAGGLLLAWSHWWHPEVLGIVLGVVSVVLLVTDLKVGSEKVIRTRTPLGIPIRARSAMQRNAAMRYALALTPLVGALVVWALSLSHINVSTLGKGGLPPALPLGWYGSLATVVSGASLSIWARRPNAWLMSAYIGATIIILFCTIPAITAVPQYWWVYKHIGVTRFIAAHGGVDQSVDLYNRWPGFFVVAASFSSWAHLDALSFAAWAEAFFSLLDAIMLAAVGFAIGRDKRVAGYAALIFTLSNWVAENYFSPQALAFTLTLALLLVFVRVFADGDVRPWAKRLMERVVRRDQPSVEFAAPLPWGRTTSVVIILGLDVIIVATHQLTPYAILLELGALLLLGVTRARWLVVVMGVITVGYLVPNLPYVSHNFGLFTSLNPISNLNKGDKGVAHLNFFQANAGGMLSVTLILFMLIAALRLARRGQGHRAIALLVLAGAPFGILFAQDYGGEASLRVFLFSSPWRDVLIALGIQTLANHRLRQAAALATCLIVAVFFIQAFYFDSELNIVPKGEVTASEYFYAHAPAGSVLLLASRDFPTRLGARYAVMRGPLEPEQPNLLDIHSFEERPLGSADIPAVIGVIHQYSSRGFVVFTAGDYHFATLNELTPPGALENLERAVATSSHFRLWYSSSDTRIYQLIG